MQLGRFELVGKIGEGAHGIVWLAQDPKLEREVAIKVLQPDMAADEGVQMRFRREMKSIARLRHPNIIELIDFSDPDAEWPYLVMERLHGETLLALVERRGPLDPIASAAAGHEISLALEHAHGTGIVHRDLKPENIFVEPNGRIVLCDFGIAVGFFKEESGTLSGKNTKLLGSPLYMSPEQIIAEAQIGPSSDLFALGSVLYYLVTGDHAFAEESVLGVLKRITAGEPHPLPEPIASSRLGRIIKKLLAPKPEDRFESADAVAEALLKVLQEGGHADARRALKQTLTGMVKPVEVSGVTALPDLDHASKTLITKVVQGKPQQWAEVTSSLSAMRTQTAVVDLTQIRGIGTTVSGQTQINTPLSRIGDDEDVGGRSYLVLIAAALILLVGIGGAYMYTQRSRTKPQPPPPVVVVTPQPSEPLPPVIPEPTTTDVPKVPKEPVVERDPPPVQTPRPPQKVVVSGKPGMLRVIAKPWAKVFIDGLEVGQTPTFRDIELQPGRHKIELHHPELASVSRSVEVKSGEETKLKVDLENP